MDEGIRRGLIGLQPGILLAFILAICPIIHSLSLTYLPSKYYPIEMPLLTVSSHPVVFDKLARLRDQSTGPDEFRRLMRGLSTLLGAEATSDLRCEDIQVQTPLTTATGKRLANKIGLVPVLRAGLGMVDGLLEFLPESEVWHLGYYRDEQTLTPVSYYQKLPPQRPIETVLLLDPMLATGGSAIAAIDTLKQWGSERIKFLGIIGSPEGAKALHTAHPDVDIHLCSLDDCLNEQGFILPGLGDAGDRLFNTPA